MTRKLRLAVVAIIGIAVLIGFVAFKSLLEPTRLDRWAHGFPWDYRPGNP